MNLTKPGKELCGGGAHTACRVNLENGMLLKKKLIEEGWWQDLLKISEVKETAPWLVSASALEDQKIVIKALVSNILLHMGFL